MIVVMPGADEFLHWIADADLTCDTSQPAIRDRKFNRPQSRKAGHCRCFVFVNLENSDQLGDRQQIADTFGRVQ